MQFLLSLASLIIFIIIFLIKKEMRQQMLWAGMLSFPLFILKVIISPQFFAEIENFNIYFLLLTETIIFGFSFGGIASVIFEIFFHKKLKLIAHPHRRHLNWLIFGPIVFLIGKTVINFSFTTSILLGFLTQAIILIYLRKDLLWDAVFSSLFLGFFYLVFYYLFFIIIPNSATTLWFSENTGISLFGLPIEEILAILSFGFLWGPLYEGIKDYTLKED